MSGAQHVAMHGTYFTESSLSSLSSSSVGGTTDAVELVRRLRAFLVRSMAAWRASGSLVEPRRPVLTYAGMELVLLCRLWPRRDDDATGESQAVAGVDCTELGGGNEKSSYGAVMEKLVWSSNGGARGG